MMRKCEFLRPETQCANLIEKSDPSTPTGRGAFVVSEAFWRKSAVEIAAGIRDRRFSCSEVMVSIVERIRALNPKLNAIVIDLTDKALAEAAAADRALQRLAGPGPLFGVPVTIKVNVDQE